MIDGHDVEEVCKAFYEAETTKDRPTAILAKTYKGKGVEGMVIGHMHQEVMRHCFYDNESYMNLPSKND